MNWTLIASAAAIALLAGCAGSRQTPQEMEAQAQAKQEALEDILNTPLAEEDYSGDRERCLSTHAYSSVEVLDDQHVLFRGTGDKVWLNKLRHRCVGLRPDDVLRFEMHTNRVCDLDSFQSLDDLMHTVMVSSNCTLGEFQPVTPEQVEAIEVAFEEARGS